jgi:ribosome-associated toxin RatA of RatAB toxin-antitoxin module
VPGDPQEAARARPGSFKPGVEEKAMAILTGRSTAEVDAQLGQVWALVEDVERAPGWQGGLKAVHALERDGEGHAVLCQTESDARVRTIKSTVRFTYNGPSVLAWRQEKGELKSVEGRWELEDLGGDRTRATYSLEVDLGRVLGLVIRGPLVDLLRGMLISARAGELKRAVESG